MIPTQESHNPEDPKQHLAWAMRNMPMAAGTGAITHPGYLAGWSEHLWDIGFRHRDWYEALADENGNIHVSQLPTQSKKFQQPFRGQRNDYNNAARWVDMDEADPQPVVIPNIAHMTQQENEAMLRQYREAGMITDHKQGPPLAEELDE